MSPAAIHDQAIKRTNLGDGRWLRSKPVSDFMIKARFCYISLHQSDSQCPRELSALIVWPMCHK